MFPFKRNSCINIARYSRRCLVAHSILYILNLCILFNDFLIRVHMENNMLGASVLFIVRHV